MIGKLVGAPLRYRPWRPRHARLVVRDIVSSANAPERTHAEHLAAATEWLCRAQDVRASCNDAGGVSAGWSFEDGWLPSYPETSGYIVETFIAAAATLRKPQLVERARRILDWELSIQQQDGAFPGHFGEPGSHPVVFNTGQIMHGMLAGALSLRRAECLEAAVRAGHWLARHQANDGSWRTYEHNGIPHTYNTRGTWALLATGLVAGEPALVTAAKKHVAWALAQQTPSGWFDNNAFTTGAAPFTHTIAYAIRGIIECGVLLADEVCLAAARKAAEAVARVQRADGWIPGTLDREWQSNVRYTCLTGVAQMALCWLRLAQVTGAEHLRENARRAIGYVKRTQRLDDRDAAVRGAIAGSMPIWGAYSRFEFPNWAAKFFADALMMDLSDAPVPPVVNASSSAVPVLANA